MAKTTSKKLNLVPTPGNILIEPAEAETKTSSGIYLPDNANTEKPQKGKVLVVGDDEVLDNGKIRKAPCKKGDIVYYKKWGGSEIKLNGKDMLLAKFDDILAIEK